MLPERPSEVLEWMRGQVGKPYVWPTSPPGMSNMDHSIDDGLEEYLKGGGKGAQHFGLHFCGNLFYQDGLFVEEVYRFHALVGTLKAGSLQILMQIVNDEFGWE